MIVVNDIDSDDSSITDKTKLVIGLNSEEVELVTMEEFEELKKEVFDIKNMIQSIINTN